MNLFRTFTLAASILLVALFVPERLAAQTDLGPAAKVDGSHIRNNESSSKEWPTIGLDYAETRYGARPDQR